ncbi:hypothetical protein [Candidatus Binatus soli]|jgi:hypothetical protein|uniref:hypothetical protein n=1 Tax=Candidatus Binatus soli TaxID=1953413 RepID=UPI003D11FB99
MPGLADSPLRECWNKLRRAEEHAQALDTEIAQFLDSQPYSVVREFDANQCKYLFRLKVLKTIPQERLACIIGDCIHNARSALDYIAWRLAGSDLDDRQTLWPVFLEPAGFEKRGLPRLTRMHPDAVAEIRRLQPYNRGYGEPSALWTLHDLDARDKHKLLTMTQTVAKNAEINILHPINSRPYPIRFSQGTFEDDVILAEVDIPAGVVNPKVEVRSNYIFDISFQQGIITLNGEYAVRPALGQILETVKRILLRFENLIAANPSWISNRSACRGKS